MELVPTYFKYGPLGLFWQRAVKSANFWSVRSALEYSSLTSCSLNFSETVSLMYAAGVWSQKCLSSSSEVKQ